MKPAVAFLTPAYAPDRHGLAIASRNEVQLLEQLGCDVQVFVTARGGACESRPAGPAAIGVRARGNGSLWKPLAVHWEGLTSELQRRRWDLVIAVGWQSWAADALLRRAELGIGDAPVILRSHGVSSHTRSGYPFRDAVRAFGWRGHDRTLATVLSTVDALVPLAQVEDEDRFRDVQFARRAGARVCPIPNILPSLGHASERARLAEPWFLSVGAFSPMKDEMALLVAYRDAGLSHLPFTLVGAHESAYLGRLRKFVQREGLKRVRFEVNPGDDRLRELYAGARCVLLASRTECQPLAVLDALAFATPFVARDVGDLREHRGGGRRQVRRVAGRCTRAVRRRAILRDVGK